MLNMENLILPTVNINGTDGKALVEGYEEAIRAADTLEVALLKITPHGRDFQLKPENYQPARLQHDALIARLDEIKQALTMIGVGIQDQI